MYQFDNQTWILDKHNKLTDLVLYSGIKKIFYVFIILVIFALTVFNKYSLVTQYKSGLLIVLLSTLLVPLVIGSLKSVTNIPCPKDIVHYGGEVPHATVLKGYPQGFMQKNKARCFPAGHASGGFSLLSLFFLFKKRKNKIFAVYFALGLGWITGFYKMMIGDHFLSHTVVSMLLAWLLILIVAKIVLLYYPDVTKIPKR